MSVLSQEYKIILTAVILLIGILLTIVYLSPDNSQDMQIQSISSALPKITISTMTPFPTAELSPTVPVNEIALTGGIKSSTPSMDISVTPPATQTAAFPVEHYITDIEGRRQYFALGCEASAAVDWAEYFGVMINEFEFQHRLPLSDNPDKGFVGNVNSPWGQVPPYAYGVHAEPIAELLREYGLPARGQKGSNIAEIKEQIASGKPVIAWVVGNVVGGVPHKYTDSSGSTTIVAAYEHVILITGYGENTIRYMNNGKFYDIPTQVFTNSWGILGNMVVISEYEY